jgi:GNAT superfamily N-acetyltransferase
MGSNEPGHTARVTALTVVQGALPASASHDGFMTADSEPQLIVLTDAEDLAELHDRVLAPSFPESELMKRSDFLNECAAGHLNTFAVRRNGALIAGAVSSGAIEPGGVILLVYLAIAPGQRGGGIGSALLTGAVRSWVTDLSPSYVLAEVEHPAYHHASEHHGDPAARVRFYARHSGQVLAVPYFQPGIGPTGPRVPAMLLLTLFVDDAMRIDPATRATVRGSAVDGGPSVSDGTAVDHSEAPELVVASPLRAFLRENLLESEGVERDDAETRALFAAVRGDAVGLWPADGLDQVPVSFAQDSSLDGTPGSA